MVEIPLTGKYGRGRVTKVSDEDYEFLAHRAWRVEANERGYESVLRNERQNGELIRLVMARVILKRKLGRSLTSEERADHINRDSFDNRRENLRSASHSENRVNSRLNRNNTSGYKGVTFFKPTGKWCAYTQVNRKRMALGHFITKEEAARAYDRAAIELFGEFAVLNFPQTPVA